MIIVILQDLSQVMKKYFIQVVFKLSEEVLL